MTPSYNPQQQPQNGTLRVSNETPQTLAPHGRLTAAPTRPPGGSSRSGASAPWQSEPTDYRLLAHPEKQKSAGWPETGQPASDENQSDSEDLFPDDR